MSKELLTRNWEHKVTSICYGLIVVSIVLLATYLMGLDKIINIIILDNYFFGIKTELFFILYHLVNILILLTVVYLVQRKVLLGVLLGIFWSLFNLTETIFDLPVFSFDPSIIFEEILFLFIYLYLLIILFGNYFYTARVVVNKIR